MAGGLEGAAALTKQLEALGQELRGKNLRTVVRAGAAPLLKAAKAAAPEGTEMHRTYKGRLVAPGFGKRSVRMVTKLDKTGEKASAAVGVRAEAFYMTQFVEVGTAKMAAAPWLRPAAQASQDQQGEAMKAAIQRLIKKAASAK